jgi:hypothetical protein
VAAREQARATERARFETLMQSRLEAAQAAFAAERDAMRAAHAADASRWAPARAGGGEAASLAQALAAERIVAEEAQRESAELRDELRALLAGRDAPPLAVSAAPLDAPHASASAEAYAPSPTPTVSPGSPLHSARLPPFGGPHSSAPPTPASGGPAQAAESPAPPPVRLDFSGGGGGAGAAELRRFVERSGALRSRLLAALGASAAAVRVA